MDYVIYYSEELWEDWVENALRTGSDIQNSSNTTLFTKKAFRIFGSWPEDHTDGDTVCLIDSRPFNGFGGTCLSTVGSSVKTHKLSLAEWETWEALALNTDGSV